MSIRWSRILRLLFIASQASATDIKKLDGTRISIPAAEQFARQTLADAHVTGAQIAVLNKGKLVWSFAYGLRRKSPDLPMTPQTTTWAASITKSVFATYVMQLVQQNEFDLDLPVAKQLPLELNQYEPYRESASEIVRDPMWPMLSPRMLLAHTSGFANFASIEPDKKLRFHFAPGTDFRYSGEGINLVQFVIEQHKKKPLADLMEQAIFSPLGMSRTGMIYRKEFEADVADRFDSSENFHAQTRRFPARAAGSMTTSAEDLARFESALFSNRIISAKTRRQMLHPFYKIRSLHQFPLRPNEGQGQESAAVGLSYGVGWGLLTHARFGPAFFKEGHGDGAQTYTICFEQSRSCMILLTNSDNGELAFRPLLEKILGDAVTPWEWEGYTPAYIMETRKHQ